MVTTRKERVVFIGAGNLATHLATALHGAGYDIVQIFSRTATSARQLAERTGCSLTTTRIEEVCPDADIYIFSVSDAALGELIARVPVRDEALYLHTAGSIPLSVFSTVCRRYGVFYPLQTFSKNRAVTFAEIPLFIEGSSPEVTATLREMGERISRQVIEATSEQRRLLHLAAVFACNFTNHLYAIAADLLARQQLPFEALRSLIRETAAKIETLSPAEAQTGPAVRYDKNVMQKHLDLLDDPDEKEIYRLLSRHIHQFATSHTQSQSAQHE